MSNDDIQALPPPAATPAGLIEWVERRFNDADLRYGHGTECARDEAAWLVLGALHLPLDADPALFENAVPAERIRHVAELAAARVNDRMPVAYLLNEAWFAGLPFYVDQRVLVPRSPIAELIEQQFAPWLLQTDVHAMLDIGTGCGCIAIACAMEFPVAMVDAVDTSADALVVARLNTERYGLEERVRVLESDVYAALAGRGYDLIVANPPYVPMATWAALPAEYRHEPRAGLASGADGLDVVRRILAGAATHLNRDGLLVVEVGEGDQALCNAFPDLPFLWPDFERGGDGVFILQRADLE